MSQGITILGLGPGGPEHLTLEAWRILQAGGEIFLRTTHHPLTPHLPATLKVRSFDALYDALPTGEAVCSAIAQEVVRLGQRPQGVLYGTPGAPSVMDPTVPHIRRLAEAARLPVHVVAGLSWVEPVLAALRISGLEGLQLLDAADLAHRLTPPLNPDLPALIGQLHSPATAGGVTRALMALYPAEYPVTLVRAAGTDDERVWQVPLRELGEQPDIDRLTLCYLPPLPQPGSPQALQETVARLRAPDGCPWDREQTHASLRSALLEETYEVLEALDSGDPEVA